MEEDVLKKYSGEVTFFKSANEADIDWEHYCRKYGETILKNNHYIMKVSYSKGKVSRIVVKIGENTIVITDEPIQGIKDSYRFTYHVPIEIQEKLKRLYFRIQVYEDDKNKVENENINDLFNIFMRVIRHFQEKSNDYARINISLLEESPNKTWLQKYGLYDEFCDLVAIQDKLKELCLGNYLTEKQLICLMEKGELFRNEKEKAEYEKSLGTLQQKLEGLEQQKEEAERFIQQIIDKNNNAIENSKLTIEQLNKEREKVGNDFVVGD